MSRKRCGDESQPSSVEGPNPGSVSVSVGVRSGAQTSVEMAPVQDTPLSAICSVYAAVEAPVAKGAIQTKYRPPETEHQLADPAEPAQAGPLSSPFATTL